MLLEQDLRTAAVPRTGPVLVRPAQAEREVDLRVLEESLDGALEHPSAVEPVVVEAEAVHAVATREVRLPLQDLGEPQVVESHVGRQAGLVVPAEPGQRLRHVRPLREPRTPPRVVLGDRVKLGEVECNQADRQRFRGQVLVAGRLVKGARGVIGRELL
jgi:hypothetical protein